MTTTATRPANGHKVDVEALYREQRGRILGGARRGTRNPDVAEDAVQDAFVDLLGKDRRPSDPGAYLATAARHAALGEMRHLGRQTPVGEHIDRTPDAEGSGHGIDACMADPEVAATVEEALSRLPEVQREAVRLFCLEGLTYNEVALRTGSKPKTVETRVRSGLIKLRQAGYALPPRPGHRTSGDDGMQPAVADALAVLRTTYGDTPPADLPGPTELRRTHGWTAAQASEARRAYVGMTVREERAAAGPPAVAEAWLNRTGDTVTAMFVNTDESTTNHPAVFRSMPGAQREITGHLVAQGYRPSGAWVDHSEDEASRNFTKEGN